MKHSHFLYLLAAALCFCTACKDDDESTKIPLFSIDETELAQDVSQAQALLIIPVRTNLPGKEWQVTSDQDWCTVAKEAYTNGGDIKIFIQESGEVGVREAAVSIKSAIQTYTVKIRQLGRGPAILVKEVPPVPTGGGEVSITVTANVPYQATPPTDADWLSEIAATRGMTDHPYRYRALPNESYDSRSATFVYTAQGVEGVSATAIVSQQALEGNLSQVAVEGDFKIKVQNAEDNGHQSGSGIDKTYDGDRGTTNHFHTPWDFPNTWPAVLQYYFDGKDDMDYIDYYPRNGNGNFGTFKLYVATQAEPDYRLYGSYDFYMKSAVSRINFSERLKNVTKVKFEVTSGAAGFASCAEMEFYRKNDTPPPINDLLLSVFTDLSCSTLKEGVTSEQINKLPGYFAQLAFAIRNDTYDPWERKFRLQDYKPYSIPEEWAAKLMTGKYSNLDNPTGIYVNPGDSVVVLVGDTHKQQVAIQCIGDKTTSTKENDITIEYQQTASNGETFFLKEGVNKVGFSKAGMLFVMYNTNLTSPDAKPIRIHIPPKSGHVSGFYDYDSDHNNDTYKELIGKSDYKYFCARGKRIIFYFHRTNMLNAVPYDMNSAIELWDDFVAWEQELMGIDDVHPSQFNNHFFAISCEHGAYMWASDYQIGFTLGTLPDIMTKASVLAEKGRGWGPGHEMGHVHQKAINWPTCTDSSNNLFANYLVYKMGKYGSRGVEIGTIAKSRCEYKEAWAAMQDSPSTISVHEIHMRMYWQLWNYYHRCGFMPDFWQQMFKALRADPLNGDDDPGAAQMKFAKTASRIANEDLTDFFDFWGFLQPFDGKVNDYGEHNYKVTQSMINDAKTYMSKFPKTKAFYYIEDRKQSDFDIEQYKVGDVGYYTQFKDNVKITKEITCTRSGRNISIKNGDQAVAFELLRNGQRVYFSNFFSFSVPGSIDITNTDIYAVQADGARIKVKE
ncbi:MAG: M60 family metallopeptidase [Mediterranea sp.]|nr:M60 family metallopeptidase [Mediterranea sp.]